MSVIRINKGRKKSFPYLIYGGEMRNEYFSELLNAPTLSIRDTNGTMQTLDWHHLNDKEKEMVCFTLDWLDKQNWTITEKGGYWPVTAVMQ